MKVKYDQDQEPICINKPTLERLLKCKKPTDCISLYVFYYHTAKWQGSRTVKATVSYCATGLDITESRVRAARKQLTDIGLIEDVQRRDKQNKVTGCYVLVHFMTNISTLTISTMVDSPQCGKSQGKCLVTNSLNADNKNEMLEGDKKQLKLFQSKAISPPPQVSPPPPAPNKAADGVEGVDPCNHPPLAENATPTPEGRAAKFNLGVYMDVWKLAYGGFFQANRGARPLKQLESMHGRELLTSCLREYCKQTEPKFASINSFTTKPLAYRPPEGLKVTTKLREWK